MSKLTLKDIALVAKKEQEKQAKYKGMIMVCTGTGCVSSGGFSVKDKFDAALKKYNLENEWVAVATGCNGFCAVGPIAVIQPEGVFYQKLTIDDPEEIVKSHLLEGKVVERLLHTDPIKGIKVPQIKEISFFSKQQLIALRNKGIIDPENIDHYIARKGYNALKKVIEQDDAEKVINDIIKSGIRGRGGGGFPTGIKWKSAFDIKNKKHEEVYIVCNADEGDPGAYMDRSIIESDPHAIIEGMLIAAHALGAKEGFIYLRKEYPLALVRLEKAIKQAREYGLLGTNILGTDFSFDIVIHRGAGAFVCGESTALMASMEGRAGEPRAKYVRSVEFGYRNKPTVLNNVETWANIPMIIEKGSEWFASIGTGDVSDNPWGGSTGTKVFSLVGDIANSGLVEVPMGITFREIVYDIGGGIPNGRKFKSVQIGGPSGGCIPESMLDMPIDFDSLSDAGAMMGSGGMIVMDDHSCMVDVARYFITFLVGESCGKCTPCREGLFAMKQILDRICTGKGEEGDIEKLEDISSTVMEGSLCGLGKSAPSPVLSSIKYFREEYEEHIKDKKCRAGVCKELITYSINENCIGCTACAVNCPEKCIIGEPKGMHVIDTDKCIKCGICYDTCKFNAVEVK